MDEKERAALMTDPRVLQLVIEATIEGETRGYRYGREAGAKDGYQSGYDAAWEEGREAGYDQRCYEESLGVPAPGLDPYVIARNMLFEAFHDYPNA